MERTKGAACLEQSQNQYLGNLSLYLELVKQFCFFQSLGASVQGRCRDGSAVYRGDQHPQGQRGAGTQERSSSTGGETLMGLRAKAAGKAEGNKTQSLPSHVSSRARLSNAFISL